MTLWPLQGRCGPAIKAARSAPTSLPPPESRDAEAAIRIELQATGGAPLDASWRSASLRFFLSGDLPTTHQLYELIFNHVTSVQVRVPDAPPQKDTVTLPGVGDSCRWVSKKMTGCCPMARGRFPAIAC